MRKKWFWMLFDYVFMFLRFRGD